MLGLVLPVPSHRLTWAPRSRESKLGMRGGWGLHSAPVLSSHWWTVSGLHFHLEKCRIFLLGLTHQLRDLHLHVNDIVWMVFLGFLS